MYSKISPYREELSVDDVKEQLLEQYHNKIFKYCFSILRDYHDAEDATQEVFIKAMESSKIKEVENQNAWLFKIAYHHCLNKVKRKRLLQFISFTEAKSVDLVQIIQEDFELNAILAQLKPEERALIVLRIVENKSFDEISLILSLKPATARKRYERIKAKIQKMIERSAK